MTWAEFLRTHWSVLAAADFFTVEVWGLRGLVTIYVFSVIELATRRISPNLNAYAERFVRSIKDAAHYHEERNHQGVGNCSIAPTQPVGTPAQPIRCSERLGGVLRFYHRAAA